MTDTIGIIVPTFNRPILLKRALQCIFEQTYTNWTLFIVNDGGYIKEVEILVNYFKKKYKSKNEIVIHNNMHNMGKAASCNIALSQLETKFVTILNDDDTWSCEFLQMSVHQLEYRNKLNPSFKGIVCISNTYFEEILDDGANTQWCETPSEHEIKKYEDTISFSTLLEYNPFSSSQFIFYKDVIGKIGMFNESMVVYSDWEFNIRFIAHFDIYRQTQPFVNIYKRFYTVDPVYNNLVAANHDKLPYYSDRINNLLLRQTAPGLTSNAGTSHHITMQTLVLLRKALENKPHHTGPSFKTDSVISDQAIVRLVHLENKFDTQAKLHNDWFKYIEYQLTSPVIRKSKKALKLIRANFKNIFANNK